MEDHSNSSSSKVFKQGLLCLSTGTDVTVWHTHTNTQSAVHFLMRRVYIACHGRGGISVHAQRETSATESLPCAQTCQPYFQNQQTAGVRALQLPVTFQDKFHCKYTPECLDVTCKKKCPQFDLTARSNAPCSLIKFLTTWQTSVTVAVEGTGNDTRSLQYLLFFFGWCTSWGLFSATSVVWGYDIEPVSCSYRSYVHSIETVAYILHIKHHHKS